MLAEKLNSGAGGPVNYIEDVFSTYLYTGNGSTQTINNGIDLAGKGGLVWIKDRTSGTNSHALVDSVRGVSPTCYVVASNTSGAQTGYISPRPITSLNSNGFSIGSNAFVNQNGDNFVSWAFAKQSKFSDVVTWTGDGTSGRQISHALGSTPGCILVKCTSNSGTDWVVYHRSLTTGNVLYLNQTSAQDPVGYFGTPTSTYFVVNDGSGGPWVNANGYTYVAYLFAHNAGGFGLTGTDNVISCGTTSGGKVTLGWEPQWILHKASNFSSNWDVIDTMRGMPWGNQAQMLNPNLSSAEALSNDTVNGQPYSPKLYADGFELGTIVGNHIYIAIRRGPMKVPTDGTKVFSPNTQNTTTGTQITTGFPIDFMIASDRGADSKVVYDRLRGVSTTSTESGQRLNTNTTGAETTVTNGTLYWNNTGYQLPSQYNSVSNVSWNFRRAPGFFDEVCYTGTSAIQNISHNLGVVPELMIIKDRTATQGWPVYNNAQGNTQILLLNSSGNGFTSSTYWNSTTPTSSVFTVGTNALTNSSGSNFVAYLFATCPGVSKVGSYTGNGSTQTINCGFTGGARFVLIKRTDSTGDWYVYDTARGITSGNDPYLLLNSTTAEITLTDYISPQSSGFGLTATGLATVNVSGASYIYLAIA